MFRKILNWFLGSGGSSVQRTDLLKEIEAAEEAELEGALSKVVELRETPIKKKKKAKAKTAKKPTKTKKKVKKAVKKTAKNLKKKPTKKLIKKKIVKKATKKPAKKTTKKAVKPKAKKTKKDEVVAYLKPRKTPATMGDIAKKVGITTQTARRYLYYLKKEGTVVKKGDGWVKK
ncbi:MAG: histidine biosynthesis protein HisIE [Candidatus Altiarchaeota archaeon]|nr:histidine biosynthesis protein HisIE [Candidatus Altiarchaeota archaeon]